MVTKEFPPFSKTPEKQYYYGSKNPHVSAVFTTAPVWPCTGALYPCTGANHKESISACQRNDLGVATVNVTPKRQITPVRSIPAPRVGACEEQKSQLSRVRPVRPLD
jgi:hypothetical protein